MSYKDQLLAMINAENNTAVTFDQVQFSTPSVYVGGEGENRNTTINVTGKASGGHYGIKPFHYRRVDLVKTFAGRHPVAVVRSGVPPIKEIVDSLNARFGITMLVDDFILQGAVDGATTVTLEVIPDSYYWLPGSIEVELEVQMVEIPADVFSPQVGGFEYEEIQ